MKLETELLPHLFYKGFAHQSSQEQKGRRDKPKGLWRGSMEPGLLSTVKKLVNIEPQPKSLQAGLFSHAGSQQVSHPVRTKDLSILF